MDAKSVFILQKVYTLFDSKCFDDFTFNCRDGKVAANRLIFALYSQFLKRVFEENPNIIKHPLLEESDFGINLPDVAKNDLQLLLKTVYANGNISMTVADYKKLKSVADILHIRLKIVKQDSSFITLFAVPHGFVESGKDQSPINARSVIKKEVLSEDENCAVDKNVDSKTNCSDNGDIMSDIDNENDSISLSDFGELNGDLDPTDEDYKPSKSVLKAVRKNLSDGSHTSTPSVCNICNITCKSWQGLKRHMGHVHRGNGLNKSWNQRKINCKCGLTFAFKAWRKHRQNCAAFKREGVTCELCQKAFESHYAMKTHQHSVHGVTVKARTCVCGKTFDTSVAYRKHQSTCEACRNAALICDDCEMPFLSKGNLIQHMTAMNHRCRKFEQSESFRLFNVCERKICKCGTTFAKNSRHSFKEHRAKCQAFMKIALICEVCNDPFEDMLSLNNHKYKAHNILTGANTCICGAKFRTSYSYRKHAVNCEDYMKIAVFCKECNQPFASERHLQFHLESGVHDELSLVA